MKYKIGDFVSKPVIGICKIEDILYLNPQDEKNNKLYYLIKPIEDEKEKIYVPVSNHGCKIFPNGRKFIVYGIGSGTWKTKTGNVQNDY